MDLRAEFRKYGFATIDCPPDITGYVRGMMEAWQVFCTLPLKRKSCFVYTGDPGTGYEFKDEQGPTKDLKENFHFMIRESPRIAEISHQIDIDLQFLNRAGMLLFGIWDSLCEFAELLEKEFGLSGIRNEVCASWDAWCLRLLHYPPRAKVGQVIASPHVDKVGLTMYLGETTRGVQYYSQKGEWVDMPVLPGKMIITPNMQMQYKTRGELTALYHQVVANEESAKNGRYSIVCFVDFSQTPQYNKAEYGRLQDMPLAFNYGMAHEEFSQFFE